MADLAVFIEDIHFFMMVLFHLFNLLSNYHVPGTLLEAGSSGLLH